MFDQSIPRNPFEFRQTKPGKPSKKGKGFPKKIPKFLGANTALQAPKEASAGVEKLKEVCEQMKTWTEKHNDTVLPDTTYKKSLDEVARKNGGKLNMFEGNISEGNLFAKEVIEKKPASLDNTMTKKKSNLDKSERPFSFTNPSLGSADKVELKNNVLAYELTPSDTQLTSASNEEMYASRIEKLEELIKRLEIQQTKASSRIDLQSQQLAKLVPGQKNDTQNADATSKLQNELIKMKNVTIKQQGEKIVQLGNTLSDSLKRETKMISIIEKQAAKLTEFEIKLKEFETSNKRTESRSRLFNERIKVLETILVNERPGVDCSENATNSTEPTGMFKLKKKPQIKVSAVEARIFSPEALKEMIKGQKEAVLRKQKMGVAYIRRSPLSPKVDRLAIAGLIDGKFGNGHTSCIEITKNNNMAVRVKTKEHVDEIVELLCKSNRSYTRLNTDSWFKGVLVGLRANISEKELENEFKAQNIKLMCSPKIYHVNNNGPKKGKHANAVIAFATVKDYGAALDGVIVGSRKIRLVPYDMMLHKVKVNQKMEQNTKKRRF